MGVITLFSLSSDSKGFPVTSVPFIEWSFKWHCNTLKTVQSIDDMTDVQMMIWGWGIDSAFLHSTDKGFWACLRDLPPDMPRWSETWVSLCKIFPTRPLDIFLRVQLANFNWFECDRTPRCSECHTFLPFSNSALCPLTDSTPLPTPNRPL